MEFNSIRGIKSWDNRLIAIRGPLDEDKLSVFNQYIDLIRIKFPQIGLKIFKIFIELSQNVIAYSAKYEKNEENKSIGCGLLLICEYDTNFIFVTGNTIYNSDKQKLFEKCEHINSLNRDNLREYKRTQRKLPQSKAGNGNIGLIQTALISSNDLAFEIVPIDEKHSYFFIEAKLDKNK